MGASAVKEMLGHEVGLEEVEVDGIVGVFGVVAGQIIGATGGEGVHFIKVVDKERVGRSGSSGFFEFLAVEGIAVAVVAAVFARKRTMRRPSWVSWAIMSAMTNIYSDIN